MGRVSPQPPVESDPITRQIELLQERYRMLGEEAARELEAMKSQVLDRQNEDKRSLQEQIDLLRTTIYQLENEKQSTEAEFQKFKMLVEDKSKALHQHIKSFSLDALNNLEEMLDAVERTPNLTENILKPVEAPPVAKAEPATIAAAQPVMSAAHTARPPKPLKVKAPKLHKVGHHSKKLVKHMVLYPGMIALLALGGFRTYQHLVPANESGQVAGATTQASSKPAPGEAENSYPESFVDLPFDQTVWESSSDSEFGISFDYPKNTSNRVKLIGGNNIWILRKYGYLLKISRITTEQTLDNWWNDSKGEYQQDTTATKDTFKGQPAWKLPSTDPAGTTYFIKHNKAILQIWVADGTTDLDDAERVKRIIESIQLTKSA